MKLEFTNFTNTPTIFFIDRSNNVPTAKKPRAALSSIINFHENLPGPGILYADKHARSKIVQCECRRRVCRSVKGQRRESRSETAILASNIPRQWCDHRCPRRMFSSIRTSHARPRDLCGCLECETFAVRPSALGLVHLRCSWIRSKLR